MHVFLFSPLSYHSQATSLLRGAASGQSQETQPAANIITSVSLGGISRANYNTANLIKHLNKTALEGIHVLTCSRSDSAKAEKKANIYFTG